MGMKYRTEEDSGSLKAQLEWRKHCIKSMSKADFDFVTTKVWTAHYWMYFRTLAFYAITLHAMIHFSDNIYIWLPLSILQGQWNFNLIWINHDAIHQNLFNKRDSSLKIEVEKWSGRSSCILPSIGSTFFRSYHAMHHHDFFQGKKDPKSTHFVPKDTFRWSRLKFWGPGILKVFLKLRSEVEPDLPVDVVTAAHREAAFNRVFHLSAMVYLIKTYSFALWFKVHFLPTLVFFPIAFMINRCGQHYCCNPKDAALQSTGVHGTWYWDLFHAYGQYHIEHHTFSEIPMYKLKYTHSVLKPMYKEYGIPFFNFSSLVWGWLVEMRPVYTVWYDLATPW